MTMSSGGRGATPPFNPSRYRGAPPELLALVKEIEDTLARPVEATSEGGAKTEYVPTAGDLDSFEVRGGMTSARVLGFETFKDNLVVSFVDPKGETKKEQVASGELLELVQKRNRALTQLESFIEAQLQQGKVSGEQRGKLQEILSNVSQYQSGLMQGIDRQLKLSEKVGQS